MRDKSNLWWRLALLNLAIAAAMGLLLRLMFLVELPITFRAWLHGHSHGAMLGWLFPAFLILGLGTLELSPAFHRKALILFALNQLATLGMFIAFPYQGYGPISIAFSTLQVLVSYAFIIISWHPLGRQEGPAGAWWKVALAFLGLSTMGLWTLAAVQAGSFRLPELMVLGTQFFLHFQFNGWFLIAAAALLLQVYVRPGAHLPGATRLLWLVAFSAILTFALTMVWVERAAWIYVLNAFGVLLQLGTAVYGFIILRRGRGAFLPIQNPLAYKLLVFAGLAFACKVLIQSLVAIPPIAIISFTLRNFVIGFIHLIMLGILTQTIWSVAIEKKWLTGSSPSLRLSIYTFAFGVFSTELLLFGQGAMFWAGWGKLPGYYTTIYALSGTLLLGIIGVNITAWRKPERSTPPNNCDLP